MLYVSSKNSMVIKTVKKDLHYERLHHVDLYLNDIEWEIVNQALRAPLLEWLQASLERYDLALDEREVEYHWTKIQELWDETW